MNELVKYLISYFLKNRKMELQQKCLCIFIETFFLFLFFIKNNKKMEKRKIINVIYSFYLGNKDKKYK